MSAHPARILALAVALASSAAAQVVYVDDTATGANDGSSWANARTDLQAALAAATAGTSVWVAEGVYRPAPPGGSVLARFAVAPGVKLYGGFSGTENSTAQRDIDAHPSILSGDLLGNDAPGFANRADNCRNVVILTDANADTVIDGFVIQGAESLNTSSPLGAGLSVGGASPLVEHCVIRNNRNASYGGGALSVAAHPRFVACTFQGNRSLVDGGGLDLESGGRVERCRFFGNTATGSGGAVFTFGVGEFHDSIFTGNSALSAGAISAMYASGVVSGCTVTGNSATNIGGLDIAGLSLANSIVWGNSGAETGGGIAMSSSTVEGLPGLDGLDPRFADANGADDVYGTLDDDLRLLPGSPCIDSGNNALVLPGGLVDVAGLRRFSDDPDTQDVGFGTPPIVDRGAHEYRACPAPVSFCVTSPNSVGPGALMSSSGTAKLYANNLVLRTTGCPPNTFGLYFHGSTTQQVSFGNGYRCVGGSVLRAGVVAADALGQAQLAFDASASGAAIAPGVQRHFQFWYRDVAGGGAGFNLTDGMTVGFCP